MAVVFRLSATVQSGQPILVQSYPTDLFTIFIPRGIKVATIAAHRVSFKNYVDKKKYEVGRYSKNAYYISPHSG